jgi:hypothetical protein
LVIRCWSTPVDRLGCSITFLVQWFDACGVCRVLVCNGDRAVPPCFRVGLGGGGYNEVCVGAVVDSVALFSWRGIFVFETFASVTSQIKLRAGLTSSFQERSSSNTRSWRLQCHSTEKPTPPEINIRNRLHISNCCSVSSSCRCAIHTVCCLRSCLRTGKSTYIEYVIPAFAIGVQAIKESYQRRKRVGCIY